RRVLHADGPTQVAIQRFHNHHASAHAGNADTAGYRNLRADQDAVPKELGEGRAGAIAWSARRFARDEGRADEPARWRSSAAVEGRAISRRQVAGQVWRIERVAGIGNEGDVPRENTRESGGIAGEVSGEKRSLTTKDTKGTQRTRRRVL